MVAVKAAFHQSSTYPGILLSVFRTSKASQFISSDYTRLSIKWAAIIKLRYFSIAKCLAFCDCSALEQQPIFIY